MSSQQKLTIRPISFHEAADYVKQYHRHHLPPSGNKFSISCWDETGKMVGVAICCRPVARRLDDGITCEVSRLCTDGTPNACSALYGACARIAREMGYSKIITYILESEPGTSLKAAGWKQLDGLYGGVSWNVPSRPRTNKAPLCKKKRFEKELNHGQ